MRGAPGSQGRGQGRAGPGPRAPLTATPAPAVASSWQVSSFSETKAQQILQQKPAQYLRFNQHQLSRIYPSSYRVDSSNYNPQPFWNAGCQMGGCEGRGLGAGGLWPGLRLRFPLSLGFGPARCPANVASLAQRWGPWSSGCLGARGAGLLPGRVARVVHNPPQPPGPRLCPRSPASQAAVPGWREVMARS